MIDAMSADPKVRQMQEFAQHGRVSTLEHCRRVAEMSCRLGELLHLPVDYRALVRGAMLHDYYLYDWHEFRGWPLHGFAHPEKALANAGRDYDLTRIEKNIIESHMWPLTPMKIPRSKEATLVCFADKVCSLQETIMRW